MCLFLLLPGSTAAFSQSDSLALTSGSGVPGGLVSLNLVLTSPAGNEPASVQWTFSYPPSAILAISVTAGQSATNAGKSVSCAGNPGSYTCVLTGINSSVLLNGVVAAVNLTLSATATSTFIGVTNTQGASLSGGSVAATGTGGTISVAVPVLLTGLACSPTTLASGAASTCTVTLNQPAPAGGTSVALANTNAASLATPASVSVVAGNSTATFTATAASLTMPQSATVSATLGASSFSVPMTLQAPVLLTGLACSPTTLASGAASTCTVTLNQTAPGGGSAINLSGNSSLLTTPVSVTVLAGSNSATFIATAGTITTTSTAVITATLNSSSLTFTLNLAAPATLSSLACTPTTVIAGSSTTCTVALSRLVSLDTAVATNSSKQAVLSTPVSVTVPAGSMSATFSATTSAAGWSSLAATLNGTTKKVVITATAGPTVTASAGTPQSTAVNTTFLAALQATVKDGSNNPMSGVTVTFTAPSTGATGTFSGAATATAVTNTSGVAMAPALTANSQAGTYTVTAIAASAAPVTFSLSNTLTTGFLAGTGDSSATTVNLTAEGTTDWVHWGDSSVNRKAGVSAQINAPSVAGQVYNNDPRRASWTDGTPTASSTSNPNGLYLSGVNNGFSFTAPADANMRTLKVHAGGYYSGGTLTAHLSDGSAPDYSDTTAMVNGQYDRNYTLSYRATAPGQTLTVAWKMTSGSTGNVTLDGVALAVPNNITTSGGTPQSTVVSTAFATALQATVKDASSNPMSGVPVTFTAPSTGASATFGGAATATALTNASGVATAPTLTASSQAGSYTVTASVAGVATPASFSLTNTLQALNRKSSFVSSGASISSLSCAPKPIQAGATLTCEARLNSNGISDALHLSLTSSSRNVRLPTSLTTRPKQASVRFQAVVTPTAGQESIQIQVAFGSIPVEETVLVLPSLTPVLTLPGKQLVKVETPLSFTVSATDGAGGPAVLRVAGLPPNASFDPATGGFTWKPNRSQAGNYMVAFTATDQMGVSSSGNVSIEVSSGKPVLQALVNGATQASDPVCSPGAVASVLGKWLTSQDSSWSDPSGGTTELGGTRVAVNGEFTPLLYASKTRVDFLCPNLSPGTPLRVSLQAGDATTAALTTTMQYAAPGIFTWDGSGSGQGAISFTGGTDLVTVRNYRVAGQPGQPGDHLKLRVTGLPAGDSAAQPLVRIGDVYGAVEFVRALPGATGTFEIGVQVPMTLPLGDAVPVLIQLPQPDGSLIGSNVVTAAVEAAQQ